MQPIDSAAERRVVHLARVHRIVPVEPCRTRVVPERRARRRRPAPRPSTSPAPPPRARQARRSCHRARTCRLASPSWCRANARRRLRRGRSRIRCSRVPSALPHAWSAPCPSFVGSPSAVAPDHVAVRRRDRGPRRVEELRQLGERDRVAPLRASDHPGAAATRAPRATPRTAPAPCCTRTSRYSPRCRRRRIRLTKLAASSPLLASATLQRARGRRARRGPSAVVPAPPDGHGGAGVRVLAHDGPVVRDPAEGLLDRLAGSRVLERELLLDDRHVFALESTDAAIPGERLQVDVGQVVVRGGQPRADGLVLSDDHARHARNRGAGDVVFAVAPALGVELDREPGAGIAEQGQVRDRSVPRDGVAALRTMPRPSRRPVVRPRCRPPSPQPGRSPTFAAGAPAGAEGRRLVRRGSRDPAASARKGQHARVRAGLTAGTVDVPNTGAGGEQDGAAESAACRTSGSCATAAPGSCSAVVRGSRGARRGRRRRCLPACPVADRVLHLMSARLSLDGQRSRRSSCSACRRATRSRQRAVRRPGMSFTFGLRPAGRAPSSEQASALARP